ncbi:hypothetical protein BH20ACT21_BH20ACT21_04340 [soil metagenome]
MANPLLRDGLIPAAVHGIIEYIAGVAFIVAPLLFGFESGSATGVSVAVGIVILLVAGTTAGPTGLVNGLSVSAHVVLDYALAVMLIIAPFVLGFADEQEPTIFVIALGIVHLLLTIATRFEGSGQSQPR